MGWLLQKTSQVGKRADNQDFAATGLLRHRRRRLTVLICCDGVGSRPDGLGTASAVGTAVLGEVERYFLRRKSSGQIGASDMQTLADKLSRLHSCAADPEGATTMALVLFDHRPCRDGYRSIVLWAGDSRAFMADRSGAFHQLTQDHHDDMGRITSFYSGNGNLTGAISTRLVTSPDPFAFAVTTDGVHGSCSATELHQFLISCTTVNRASEAKLGEELEWFLSENISDNFSLAMSYRPQSRRRIEALARNMTKGESR